MSYALVYGIVAGGILVGLVALGFIVWALAEALRVREELRRLGIGNGRRLVAIRAVRAEQARTATVALVVLGLVILLASQPSPSTRQIDDDVPVTTAAVLIAFHASLAVAAIDAVAGVVALRRLDEELERSHARLRAADALRPDEDDPPGSLRHQRQE